VNVMAVSGLRVWLYFVEKCHPLKLLKLLKMLLIFIKQVVANSCKQFCKNKCKQF